MIRALTTRLLGWIWWPHGGFQPHEGGPHQATATNLLLAWDWRPEIILPLVFLGVCYSLGWWRLRRQGRRRLATSRRLASYLGGLAILAVALLSAVDSLQSVLFSVHMVQHELLMMVTPPLLLLANPLPFLLWGLPAGPRQAVGSLLSRRAAFRRVVRHLTRPWVAWALYVGALWLWHVPVAYDAALRYDLIHDLEHLSFFGTAMLFWWHVTGAAPRIHGSLGYGLRMAYVLAALVQNEILGVSIAFADQPIYLHYTTVPRLWGLSVLEDQMLGGAIMWIPGGMMYVAAVVLLLFALLAREEKETDRARAVDLHLPEPVAQ